MDSVASQIQNCKTAETRTFSFHYSTIFHYLFIFTLRCPERFLILSSDLILVCTMQTHKAPSPGAHHWRAGLQGRMDAPPVLLTYATAPTWSWAVTVWSQSMGRACPHLPENPGHILDVSFLGWRTFFPVCLNCSVFPGWALYTAISAQKY